MTHESHKRQVGAHKTGSSSKNLPQTAATATADLATAAIAAQQHALV